MFAKHTTPCRYPCTMQHARKEGILAPGCCSTCRAWRSSPSRDPVGSSCKATPEHCWVETTRSQFGRMHCLGVREAVAEASLVPGPCLRHRPIPCRYRVPMQWMAHVLSIPKDYPLAGPVRWDPMLAPQKARLLFQDDPRALGKTLNSRGGPEMACANRGFFLSNCSALSGCTIWADELAG